MIIAGKLHPTKHSIAFCANTIKQSCTSFFVNNKKKEKRNSWNICLNLVTGQSLTVTSSARKRTMHGVQSSRENSTYRLHKYDHQQASFGVIKQNSNILIDWKEPSKFTFAWMLVHKNLIAKCKTKLYMTKNIFKTTFAWEIFTAKLMKQLKF